MCRCTMNFGQNPLGQARGVVYVCVGEKGWWDAIGLCEQLGRQLESVPPMEHERCEKGVAAPRSWVPQSRRGGLHQMILAIEFTLGCKWS